MSRIILVRHGDTAANSRERFWGCTDVTLSETGLLQAESLRRRLAGEKISAIYASDLCRALVTAQTINQSLSAPLNSCPELREINFGEIEGLNFTEIGERYPDLAKLWQERSTKLKYPGGEGIEEFEHRVRGFLPRLDGHNSDETVLVVAHSATLRMLICRLLGIGLEHWWQMRIELASLSIIATFPAGAVLQLLNDTCHLKDSHA